MIGVVFTMDYCESIFVIFFVCQRIKKNSGKWGIRNEWNEENYFFGVDAAAGELQHGNGSGLITGCDGTEFSENCSGALSGYVGAG